MMTNSLLKSHVNALFRRLKHWISSQLHGARGLDEPSSEG
jgi:hypothetical protein